MGRVIIPAFGEDERYLSVWNMAMIGHPHALASLGLPTITAHEYPIAFVKDKWSIVPETKCIWAVKTPELKKGDPGFDVMGFFHGLYKDGKLPLASEDDAARLVMAIASPFLREIAPGLLGCYWNIGPSGAGKELLAEIPPMIWQNAIIRDSVKVAFEINKTDDLELKRTFYAAHPAVYGRAKEAGKRKNFVEILIRLSGTKWLSARGMRKDEIEVLNSFTFIADSAEDLPERREVSRRTVVINAAFAEEDESKGAMLADIVSHASDIIHSLKRTIESKDQSWYLHQNKTDSRPIIPVALARLFGAKLPVVEGRNLDDLFEALLVYRNDDGLSENDGKEQLEKCKARGTKDGKEATTFESFSYSRFCDEMAIKSGYKLLIKEFGSKRLLKMGLNRELSYHEIEAKKKPYLRVPINGAPYAFRLIKDDRNFILEPELKYCDALGINPISSEDQSQPSDIFSKDSCKGKDPTQSPASETPIAPASSGPISVNGDELRQWAKGTGK